MTVRGRAVIPQQIPALSVNGNTCRQCSGKRHTIYGLIYRVILFRCLYHDSCMCISTNLPTYYTSLARTTITCLERLLPPTPVPCCHIINNSIMVLAVVVISQCEGISCV